MVGRNDDQVRCSFCNKTQNQVRKLIAGPNGAYICDECIDVCTEILEEEFEYSIVGKTESDPDQKKISDQSPLGMALLGNKKGAKVTVEAPGGNFVCEIREIKLAD